MQTSTVINMQGMRVNEKQTHTRIHSANGHAQSANWNDKLEHKKIAVRLCIVCFLLQICKIAHIICSMFYHRVEIISHCGHWTNAQKIQIRNWNWIWIFKYVVYLYAMQCNSNSVIATFNILSSQLYKWLIIFWNEMKCVFVLFAFHIHLFVELERYWTVNILLLPLINHVCVWIIHW